MRLWFVNDTKSYVFYPQHKIQKHTLLRRLSDLEFREIATRVENLANLKKEQALEEKKAEEMRSEAASLAKEKSTEVAKKEPEPGLAKPNLTPEQIEEQQKQEQEMAEGKALLERFAPEAGWGQAKIEAIRKRRVNDVYPTKEEAEFEKGYALWKKAYDVMLEEQRLAELEAQKNAERAVNAPREN